MNAFVVIAAALIVLRALWGLLALIDMRHDPLKADE